MPHIAVSLYPGRDQDTKRDIAERVAEHFSTTFGFAPDAVSVSIVEIQPEEFVPTIQQRYRSDELYVPSRFVTAEIDSTEGAGE